VGREDTPPSPRRQAAGRENRRRRGPLTEAGRRRLREAAVRVRPWGRATGPKTPEGKATSAANGRLRQRGSVSTREARAELAEARRLIGQMRELRRTAARGGH
jgi:hypothetical protein